MQRRHVVSAAGLIFEDTNLLGRALDVARKQAKELDIDVEIWTHRRTRIELSAVVHPGGQVSHFS